MQDINRIILIIIYDDHHIKQLFILLFVNQGEPFVTLDFYVNMNLLKSCYHGNPLEHGGNDEGDKKNQKKYILNRKIIQYQW